MDKLYDDLVALTYECVLNESTWPDLLDRLVEGTGRLHGAMVLFEGPTPGGQQITGIHCCDPKLVRDYNAYYHQYDPWSGYIPKQSPGLFHHDTQCFDAEILDKGIFHQEHLRKWGIRSISCSKLFKNHESAIYLGLDNDRDPASLPEWRNHLLQLIAPHLARAATLARKLDRLDLELQKRDLLLAQSEIPLWLVNKRSTVLFCNPAAERSQTEPAFMLRERQNRLQARDSASALPALIRTACGHNGPARAGWLHLADGSGRELLVAPVSAQAQFNRMLQEPLALVALLDNRLRTQQLAEIFQFTPAECRLAELLAKGHTPDVCATQLGVSITTVRSQLRALFRKTGTERQAELVRLLVRASSYP